MTSMQPLPSFQSHLSFVAVAAERLGPLGGELSHSENPHGMGYWIDQVLMNMHFTDFKKRGEGRWHSVKSLTILRRRKEHRTALRHPCFGLSSASTERCVASLCVKLRNRMS